jgi:hypothetical protein
VLRVTCPSAASPTSPSPFSLKFLGDQSILQTVVNLRYLYMGSGKNDCEYIENLKHLLMKAIDITGKDWKIGLSKA